jgi:hypothetical protein
MIGEIFHKIGGGAYACTVMILLGVICLTQPEAHELEAQGQPTVRQGITIILQITNQNETVKPIPVQTGSAFSVSERRAFI